MVQSAKGNRVNRHEIVTYLSDSDGEWKSDMGVDISVVEIAASYGMELTWRDNFAIEYATGDIDPTVRYLGDLIADIKDLANNAMTYLHANDIAPYAYDHGQRETGAGFGAARRDGAEGYDAGWGMLYGAQWVVVA